MEVLGGHFVGKLLLCRMSLVNFCHINTKTSLIRFERESLEFNSLPITWTTSNDHAKSVIRVTDNGLDQTYINKVVLSASRPMMNRDVTVVFDISIVMSQRPADGDA